MSLVLFLKSLKIAQRIRFTLHGGNARATPRRAPKSGPSCSGLVGDQVLAVGLVCCLISSVSSWPVVVPWCSVSIPSFSVCAFGRGGEGGRGMIAPS